MYKGITMNTAQKVKRIAQVLSRVMTQTQNIEVTIKGKTAYRTPGLINVPAGDFTNPDVSTMTLGYIDHELGHEKHTSHHDFVAVARLSPTHKHFINMVEDVRMETAVGNEFSGAKGNLRKLAKLAIDKELFAQPESDFKPIQLVQMLVLYRGRYQVIGQECLRDYALEAEVIVRSLLGDDTTDEICQLVDSIAGAQTTEDSGAIALEIMRLLEDLQQDEDPSQDDSEQSQDSDDDDSNDDSNDDSESDPEAGDDSSDNEDDSEDDSSEPSDSNDSQDGDESDDSEGNSGDENSDEDDAEDNSDSTSDDGDDSEEQSDATPDNSDSEADSSSDDSLQKAIEEILNASEDDGLEDIHEMIAKELEDDAEENGDPLGELSGNMPSPLSIVRDPALLNPFDERKSKTVGKRVFQKMSRVLIDKDNSLHIHRTVGKRIDARRLAGVAAGNNRLFHRRQEQPDTSAAISFVVDASWSMNGQMTHTNEVAYAMCHGLNQSGISTEVLYFSVQNSDETLGIHIAKSFDSKHINPKAFRVLPDMNTPTGPSMLNAVSRLAGRQENRKLLFVLTDGEANNESEVIWAREFAEAIGIKVIPIGLNTDYVSGFRPEEFKNVTDLSDLPSAINHAIQAKLFA